MSERSRPIVHSAQPYNAEPTPARLRENFWTGQGDFYVRCHGNVPAIDAGAHRLAVTGLVDTPLTLSLDDLRRRFREHTVAAVMQCAGNRRADLRQAGAVSGDPWGPGAIGNASWTGVALADVLRAAGARNGPGLHVAFSSGDECDVDGEHFRYGASIPMAKALEPDVLLATAMNGQALAPEHGFPLRVVVPGYAGVRSPKWLIAIEVRDTPSTNPIQDKDYKLLPPDIRSPDAIDWSRGETINEMPLNSAICEPAADAVLQRGPNVLRGWAVASGRPIRRVDVSSDGGVSWRQAGLETEPAAPASWTLWSLTVDLPPGRHELVVRAWDGAGQTQPSRPDDVWNVKGYLSTAMHRIAVTVR